MFTTEILEFCPNPVEYFIIEENSRGLGQKFTDL
jgi:hypothetical protein